MDVLKGFAVLAAIVTAGYLAVDRWGWEPVAELLGIEVSHVVTAAESQCEDAREQETRDETVACIPDRKWGRRYFDPCAKGEEPGLVVVDLEGELVDIPKCSPGQGRWARSRLDRPIPNDYNVAERIPR